MTHCSLDAVCLNSIENKVALAPCHRFLHTRHVLCTPPAGSIKSTSFSIVSRIYQRGDDDDIHWLLVHIVLSTRLPLLKTAVLGWSHVFRSLLMDQNKKCTDSFKCQKKASWNEDNSLDKNKCLRFPRARNSIRP